MKCPSCDHKLVLGGQVSEAQIVLPGQKLDPEIRSSIYWCENTKCPKYLKSQVYDELLKKWK